MHERITLISLLDTNDLNRIKEMICIDSKALCKVPYLPTVKDRAKVDTLPFHFTLSTWDIKQKDFVLEKLNTLSFSNFTVLIDGIDIKPSINNSYCLYFSIQINDMLHALQKQIYTKVPNEKYNPTLFTMHMTIHCDKDYDTLLKFKKKIEKNFKAFELHIRRLGLFEIYPAKQIKMYNAIS